MGRKKHRSQLDAIDEINMTPLIDLTFLLLIIFMITTPLLEYGTDVSPPEMNADRLPDENTKSVGLDRDGRIVYEKRVLTTNALARELAALYQQNTKTTILVKADGSQPYKKVIDLMKQVRTAGFKNISLVTQSE